MPRPTVRYRARRGSGFSGPDRTVPGSGARHKWWPASGNRNTVVRRYTGSDNIDMGV